MNNISKFNVSLLLVLLASSAIGDVSVISSESQHEELKGNHAQVSIANPDGSDQQSDNSIEQAVLSVDESRDQGTSCVFSSRLRNATSYHIGSVVLRFSAIIKDNVVYDTISQEFFEIKPTKEQIGKIQFLEISCTEILGLSVIVSKYCTMGSLTKPTSTGEECGKRIRLDKSNAVKVHKEN